MTIETGWHRVTRKTDHQVSLSGRQSKMFRCTADCVDSEKQGLWWRNTQKFEPLSSQMKILFFSGESGSTKEALQNTSPLES